MSRGNCPQCTSTLIAEDLVLVMSTGCILQYDRLGVICSRHGDLVLLKFGALSRVSPLCYSRQICRPSHDLERAPCIFLAMVAETLYAGLWSACNLKRNPATKTGSVTDWAGGFH